MRGAAALAAFVLALALASCGGGGDSSPSASSPTVTTTPARPRTSGKVAGVKIGSVKSAADSHSPRSSSHGSGSATAVGAAAFVTPHGDNSIPNYGSNAAASERTSATADLRAYLRARAAGNWSTACSYLAGTVRGQVEALAGASGGGKHKGCAAAYAALSANVPPAKRASPLSGSLAALRIKGTNGFALFYGPHDQQYVMPMASEGGVWKANQIEPIPYPIGEPAG